MPVDPNSHVPIYEQIVDHIRGAVAAGIHRVGDPLPSIRNLALEFLVNPNTVQRACQELERQGLVVKRKGRGMFVADGANDSAQSSSESAVRSKFEQGIVLGRKARVTDQRMQALFGEVIDGGGISGANHESHN